MQVWRTHGGLAESAPHKSCPPPRPQVPRVSPKGDALLALWKVERKQLKNIITVVIKCSLEIHGLFEAQEVEEGLDVRVKIGELLGGCGAGEGGSGDRRSTGRHLRESGPAVTPAQWTTTKAAWLLQ